MDKYIIVLFLGLLLTILHQTYAKIFSTEHFESRSEAQPTLVLLESEDRNFNQPLQKFMKFIQRNRRDATDGDSSHKDLSWHKFNLGNDTTHNQALIHWSGNYSSVIFILTRRKDHSPGGRITHSTLWRSTDYGITFLIQQHKFTPNTVLQSYFVCPTNKSKVIFIDTFNQSQWVWVSSDEGESYRNYSTGFSVNKIEFHPTEQDWLLGYDKNSKMLYVSQNLGATWSHLQSGVTKDRYFWYVKGVDLLNTVVHMEYRYLDVMPESVYLIKCCTIPNCTRTDFQQHCDALGKIDQDSLVVQNDYTFAQKTGAKEKLYVSYKRGAFKRAKFDGANEQTDFHIVSSDSGSVVTGVKHSHLNGQTDLFFSDTLGKYFTLSLSNVRYFQRKSGDDYVFTVDIHEVKAVSGTFLANQRALGQNITKITSDNGRVWRPVKAPKVNVKNQTYPHCAKCSLNLHVAMSQTKSGYYMPGMMSKSTIPGLVISHGSVGRTLMDAPSMVNVYVSNDAGNTWREVLFQRHLFVAADHGAMMVAVQMIFLKPVKSLYFSNDVGKTWTKHVFSDEVINVDGLLTEPGEYTHKFTLFGHRNYKDHWKLFALDFAPLVERNCTYPGDYSNWTLATAINQMSTSPQMDQCHLGVQQIYERVSTAGCLVGPEYKRVVQKVVCNCSNEDYECDFGYVMMDGDCKKKELVYGDRVSDAIDDGDGDVDFVADSLFDNSTCVNGQRKVHSGFRKIPGDVCLHDLPMKLFTIEPCVATTQRTPATTPTVVHLRLLNKTNEAKIGDEIHFSVMGGSQYDLTVVRTLEPGKKIATKVINGSERALIPKHPGNYRIKAYNPADNSISDTLIVSFWYPILEVHIYHPPVVEVNTSYNATVRVSTKYGLIGTSSLIGDVQYFWESDDKVEILVKPFTTFRHPNVKTYQLDVTANNKVSHSSSKTLVTVKDYVITLVLPLKSNFELNESNFTHSWLRDLRSIIDVKLFKIPNLKMVLTQQGVVAGESFHVFVEPRMPLKATIHFSPTSKGKPSKDHLFQAATLIEKLVVVSKVTLDLPKNVVITIVDPYVINDDGLVIPYEAGNSSISSGVIALIVILSILLIAGIIVITRKYVSKSRWSSYFLAADPRNIGFRRSHIVRSRNQDRSPIVDNEEFVDDELDTLDQMTTDQGGTLQFQG